MLIFQLLFGCIFSIQKHQWSSCLCYPSLAYSSYPKDEDNWDPDITFCHQFNHQNLQKLIEHVYLKVSVSSNFLRILETLQSQLCCSLLAFIFFPYTHTTGICSKPSFRWGREIEYIFCSNLSTICFHKTKSLSHTCNNVTKHYGKNCESSL